MTEPRHMLRRPFWQDGDIDIENPVVRRLVVAAIVGVLLAGLYFSLFGDGGSTRCLSQVSGGDDTQPYCEEWEKP